MKKETSINFLRAIATLLITNSHFDALYPASLSFLGFGGLFGNCLFFYISGYCLTRPRDPFPQWYGRRIVRVYTPYVLFLPLLLLTGYRFLRPLYWVFPIEPYHFLPTIMTLYPVFYLFARLHESGRVRYPAVLAAAAAAQLLYFFLFVDKSGDVVEHYTVMGLLSYFVVMLLGAIHKECRRPVRSRWYLLGVLACFALYTLQVFVPLAGALKILQWEMAIVFAFCAGGFFVSLEEKLPTLGAVELLAPLTLEIYLVQLPIIEAFSHLRFPAGLIYALVSVVGCAWALHWLAAKVTKRLLKPKNT